MSVRGPRGRKRGDGGKWGGNKKRGGTRAEKKKTYRAVESRDFKPLLEPSLVSIGGNVLAVASDTRFERCRSGRGTLAAVEREFWGDGALVVGRDTKLTAL